MSNSAAAELSEVAVANGQSTFRQRRPMAVQTGEDGGPPERPGKVHQIQPQSPFPNYETKTGWSEAGIPTKKPAIRSMTSRALLVHEVTASQELASSWSEEHVLENAMKRYGELEKKMAVVQKEMEKVQRQIKAVDELPDGDERKVILTRDKCGQCVDRCFGTTPSPRPCGSGGYQVQWFMSGLFVALVKYVFAITCALIIHEADDVFKSSIPTGINVQLLCIIVSQFPLMPFTQIGVTIAGPDVIAAIFAEGMAEIIADNTRDNPERALPSLLFCIALSTLSCAIAFLLIGYLRAARIVDYLPVCVVCGFLGCLAYKVLYYAIKIAVGDYWYSPGTWEFWRLLLPIVPLGCGLYYLKKYHHQLHVSPILLLALFLFVPIAIMYIAMAGLEQTPADLIEQGWLFESINSTEFWNVWTDLDFTQLDGTAILLCLPYVLTTVIVCTMAFLIQLQAAKQIMKMPEVDAADEMKLFGWINVLATLFIAAPPYTQIKFTLLNFHIIENKTDKKPGFFAATFALVMMLATGFTLINWLPRLTLGMLLVYGGLPLVEDNLIFSFKRVTKKEFVTIWIIVLVNAIAGVWTSYSFLMAVGTGLVLATIIFAVQYGRNPVIRDILSGRDYQSAVVRPYTEQRLVEKIGIRTKILELEGFLFFGSTIQILNKFKAAVDKNKDTPFPERMRYVIVDFTHVKNIDHSSCLTFEDLKQMANRSFVVLVFAGMNDKVLIKMRAHGVLPPEDAADLQPGAVVMHSDLDHAAEWVEDKLLKRATEIRSQWLVFDSFRKAHSEAIIKASCEAFEAVIGSDVGANLWKYATLRTLDKGQVLCRQGSFNTTLYVLQEGVLTSFVMDQNDNRKRLHKMTRGAFVNDECLFLDLPVAFSVVANRKCMLWAITRSSMKKMEAHDPHLAMEILRKVLRHTSTVRTRLEREVRIAQHEMIDEAVTKQVQVRKKQSEATQRLGKSIIARSASLRDGGTGSYDDDEIDDEEWNYAVIGSGVDDVGEQEAILTRRNSAVGWASGDHHHHAFQHLRMPNPSSPYGDAPTPPFGSPASLSLDGGSPTANKAGGDSPESSSGSQPASPHAAYLSRAALDNIRPHLSKQVLEDAKRCFYFHAEHIHLVVNDELGIVERQAIDDVFHHQTDLDAELDIPPPFSAQRNPNQTVAQRSVDKYLDIDELEKAVMDLGVFPTHEEIEAMHNTLMHGHARDYVDLEEFLDMIRALKLAVIPPAAKRELYKMYRRVCNEKGLLSRQNLAQLMASLGHPEDEVEMEKLMHDWDVKGRGFLDFDAFLSIVSATLKAEEIQVQCENDFKRFNPDVADSVDGAFPAAKAMELLNYKVTVEDLIRVHNELGLVLAPEIAEEMLFDADISGSGGVDYDDFISCIETIGTKEVYDETKKNHRRLRAIQEAKMGETFKVAIKRDDDKGNSSGEEDGAFDDTTAPLQLVEHSFQLSSPAASTAERGESHIATIHHRTGAGGGHRDAAGVPAAPIDS